MYIQVVWWACVSCTKVELHGGALGVHLLGAVLQLLLRQLPELLHEQVHGGGEAQVFVVQPVDHKATVGIVVGEQGAGQRLWNV